MSHRGDISMTPAAIRAHAAKNRLPVPRELRPNLPDPAKLREQITGKRKGDRRLKKHREPNETEKRYGLVLNAMARRGEIESYGFEEITLRWADMEYTPDYFVIARSIPTIPRLVGPGATGNESAEGTGAMRTAMAIEAVYVEIKGAWKWQDSIVKFKAARARFTWARFEMWDYVDGRWTQLA